MNNAAMNFDIKALLTLLLLKSGTSSKDIQTAVNMAAAARLMVAEESAEPEQSAEAQETNASNVTKISADSERRSRTRTSPADVRAARRRHELRHQGAANLAVASERRQFEGNSNNPADGRGGTQHDGG